jgi:hypothetical protein
LSSTESQNLSRAQLRNFGLILAGGFAVIALWPTIFRGEMPRMWASIVAVVFVLWGLLLPTTLSKPFRAWMTLGGFLGWLNSKVLLSVVFFVMVTPLARLMALFGYDPMKRRFDPAAETYREKRQPRPPSHMSRQF